MSETPTAVKPGRHREAVLHRALHGEGAAQALRDRDGGVPSGRLADELRAAALAAYPGSELPTWRRSGFWSTTLRDLEIDTLSVRHHAPSATLPPVVAQALEGKQHAGLLVQRDGSVVHVQLDAELTAKGVILTSLEQAASEHSKLFERHFFARLTTDRHKLELANAAFWSGGAFLYVPPGVAIERPIDIVYTIDGPGSAQYAHTLVIGDRGSDFRLHEYYLAPDFGDEPQGNTQALHAGAFECYLHDGARARIAHAQDWGDGDVFDVSTRYVGVGRDAYCHWLPSLLGGHLTRQHLELAVEEKGGDMAFRGVFFTQGDEHLDLFGVDLHETGPSGGDVHWRGAATGASQASFEGLIAIDPGAQQTHTYLQIHTMMLSPQAKIDAIPSVLVSADDVSASHGGTVGELDESLIFYMQSRGLDRPAAVRVIVEGFFEPLIDELDDEHLESFVRAKIAGKLAAAAGDIEAYALNR